MKSNQTFLETISKEEEVQAVSAVVNVKKFLGNTEEAVENQIIYSLESVATALYTAVQTYSISKAQLEMFTMSEKLKIWSLLL